MTGPPGTGKSLLARALPEILPPLTQQQSLAVTKIHSVAGLLAKESGLIKRPPFRAPHVSASAAGILGGGSPFRPGELTLAHHGVLFLDELPEFNQMVTSDNARHLMNLVRRGLAMVDPETKRVTRVEGEE